jgi:hypothetical protein
MNSKYLSTAQAQAISKSLFHLANYPFRLKSSMENVGFLPSDPLYLKVKAAYDAVFDLSIDFHYLSCSSGVGRSPKKAGMRIFTPVGIHATSWLIPAECMLDNWHLDLAHSGGFIGPLKIRDKDCCQRWRADRVKTKCDQKKRGNVEAAEDQLE